MYKCILMFTITSKQFYGGKESLFALHRWAQFVCVAVPDVPDEDCTTGTAPSSANAGASAALHKLNNGNRQGINNYQLCTAASEQDLTSSAQQLANKTLPALYKQVNRTLHRTVRQKRTIDKNGQYQPTLKARPNHPMLVRMVNYQQRDSILTAWINLNADQRIGCVVHEHLVRYKQLTSSSLDNMAQQNLIPKQLARHLLAPICTSTPKKSERLTHGISTQSAAHATGPTAASGITAPYAYTPLGARGSERLSQLLQ
ncbi:hypothetical protein Bbelb_082590 [Branchiostoma belcheri]|nr:hypothetical protein Bbelb_082590 [Branchiostoma belcheri]